MESSKLLTSLAVLEIPPPLYSSVVNSEVLEYNSKADISTLTSQPEKTPAYDHDAFRQPNHQESKDSGDCGDPPPYYHICNVERMSEDQAIILAVPVERKDKNSLLKGILCLIFLVVIFVIRIVVKMSR